MARSNRAGVKQPRRPRTTRSINAPTGERVDRRCKRAVGRAVPVGFPGAPNGSVSAASGPGEAKCSWRGRLSAGFEDGCRGGIWARVVGFPIPDPRASSGVPGQTAYPTTQRAISALRNSFPAKGVDSGLAAHARPVHDLRVPRHREDPPCGQLAYAIATGGEFIRWTAPKPRKVLYLDGELPGNLMQKRLLMHCPDVEPAPGYLRVFTPDLLPDDQVLPDLSTYSGQLALDDMVQDAEVVIVDNLSAWARSGRENEAESWLPVADWILSLRRRGIAVILIHHAGKGGLQRGTSKREDLLDAVIGLSRPTDYEPSQGAVFIAEFTKARNLSGTDAESLELKLGGDDDRALWTWRTVESSTYDRVVALTKDGLTPAEICNELEINKSTVSRNLRKAKELGAVSKEGNK